MEVHCWKNEILSEILKVIDFLGKGRGQVNFLISVHDQRRRQVVYTCNPTAPLTLPSTWPLPRNAQPLRGAE